MAERRPALRRGVLAVLCVALSACASIPLGTLWTLRGFDLADLATLAPEQVRVAARVDAPAMEVSTTGARLVLELTPQGAGAVERHAFALRPATVSDASLAPAGGRPWRVFQLDDDSRRAMRALQPVLGTLRERYSGASFSVNADFDGAPPPGTREIVFSVRLRLSDAQAPFTLFDRARMPLTTD
jgi:hypothetical protein